MMGAAEPSAGQQVSVAASRWLTNPHVMDYRLSLSRYRIGPLGIVPFGQLTLRGPRSGGSKFAGVGADVVLRIRPNARPYLVGGLSGGFLDLERHLGLGLWHAWSAGGGVELFRAEPLSAAIEVRYQALSQLGVGGMSIGLRLGTPFGQGRPRVLDGRTTGSSTDARAPQTEEPSPSLNRRSVSPPDDPKPFALATAAVSRPLAPIGALDVVAEARSVMGTPYRWGGADANGFDCSGLIQFAYRTVGIALPRRSVDQARHGRSVPLEVGSLAPGDLLAFGSGPGGPVTHIGLYVGGGRFIHSASGGVVESDLDAIGSRWWLDRWVGARRLL